jgi:hypothetical protein
VVVAPNQIHCGMTMMIADAAQQRGEVTYQYTNLTLGAIMSKVLHDAWRKANLGHDIHTINAA